MNWTEVIGFSAGTLSAITFLPQVIKTWRMKAADELSLMMILFVMSSVILWAIYGVLIANKVIIFTNSVIFVLSVFLVFLKLKFR